MFYGATHIDIQVGDLERATRFWCDTLGLTETKKGEGFVDVDSGSVKLRLVQSANITSTTTIRINAGDIQAAYDALIAAGTRPLHEPVQTPDLELVAAVKDPDGHTVLVWRDLTEDEYDFVPDLPTESQWQTEAEILLKQLLTHVPALFRATARKRCTRTIEELGTLENTVIGRDQVIRGYILASPKFMRHNLRDPLNREGINPDDYKDIFESD
ncbi:MAG: DUF2621 family protein [Gammaproteobacteria bacterium]|nr:DUF2621 family protein [Gammaproteobacteria bacterium]